METKPSYATESDNSAVRTEVNGRVIIMPEQETLHDKYTMAALTGLLANPQWHFSAEVYLSRAHYFADLEMEARKP